MNMLATSGLRQNPSEDTEFETDYGVMFDLCNSCPLLDMIEIRCDVTAGALCASEPLSQSV